MEKVPTDNVQDVVRYGRRGEQRSPLSLSRPAHGEGSLHGMVDAIGSHEQGIDNRCDAAPMMLAWDIDESASDVVVYGMVSRSPASLGQPRNAWDVSFLLKAGYIEIFLVMLASRCQMSLSAAWCNR